MEILKLRSKILLCLIISINQVMVGQESLTLMDIEKARLEIIKQNDYMFSESYIRDVSTDRFNVYYFDNKCLVHLKYKNTETHSSEKFSYVLIYYLEGKSWVYQSSFPYYYDLKMLDSQKGIFISDNLFCGMNGSCNRLVEISEFSENALRSIISYEGFNNTLHYDRLLVFDKNEDVLKSVEDTICNDFVISEIIINERGLASYKLTQDIGILKGVESDTLDVLKKQQISKIELDK